jgi:hypothetical protein
LFVGGDVSFNSRLYVANSVLIGISGTPFQLDVSGSSVLRGDVSLNNRLFVGKDVSFNNNFYVKNDTTINNRLFITGDVSINNGNLTVLNNNVVYSRVFDSSNTSYSSPSFDTSGIYFGINSTSINIGSYGYGKSSVSCGKIFTFGSGSFYGIPSPNLNTFYIGSAGDNIYINGNTVFQNQTQIQYTSPLLQINTPYSDKDNNPKPAPSTTASYDTTQPPNLIKGAGISIGQGANYYAGYMLVSNDTNGLIFKAPGSNNSINLNIGSLTLPSPSTTQQQALSTSPTMNISNGILVLTNDLAISNKTNFGITVRPIDISNIFLRDINSTPSYQQILTNVGISGDLTVMLNNRLFVNSDVSFNSRLLVYSDASFSNRVFIGNDLSVNANIFVSNISKLIGPIYQF